MTDDLGPACKALAAKSPKLLAFALHRAGGMTLWRAAQGAGYSTIYDLATQPAKAKRALTDNGSKMLQREDVQAALHEIVQAQLKGAAGRAIKVIEQIAFGGSAPPAVQLKAAQDLANRAGHAPVQQVAVDHTHRVERPLTLEDLFRQAGVELPDELRQGRITARVVDAEFEPVPSTAGLEDLLEVPVAAEPTEHEGEIEDDDLVLVEED